MLMAMQNKINSFISHMPKKVPASSKIMKGSRFRSIPFSVPGTGTGCWSKRTISNALKTSKFPDGNFDIFAVKRCILWEDRPRINFRLDRWCWSDAENGKACQITLKKLMIPKLRKYLETGLKWIRFSPIPEKIYKTY